MRRPMVTSLALVLTAAVADCSDAIGPGASTVDLGAAKARWASHGLTNYQITITQSCFCINVHPIRFTITADTVRSGMDLVTGEAVDPSLGKTVNQLFKFISDGLARPFAKLDAHYDAIYGFPFEIDYDGSIQVADDEGSIGVRDLRAITNTR